MMEKEGNICEGQAGFRPNRSCVGHVYTLDKITQGRKDAGLATYLVLYISKCTGGLRHSREKRIVEKNMGIGIRGRMWRMMKKMTEGERSAVMLDGEISKYVDTLQGVALSPDIFKIYIDDLIVADETAKQRVTVGEDTVSGLMFADDVVGISKTPEGLQKQIETALEYTKK